MCNDKTCGSGKRATTRENEKYVEKEINLLLLPLGLLALNYQSPSSTNCVKWKKRQIINNY